MQKHIFYSNRSIFFFAVYAFTLFTVTHISQAEEESPPALQEQTTETAEVSIEAQVKVHFQNGRDAISKRNWKLAISELEAALKLDAEHGPSHHALGVAYMGDEQSNAGWFHFRQAVRHSPNYTPGIVDFMKTWKLLDAQGLFNVGTSMKVVAQTLGKPDQAEDAGARLRVVYGFMSINFLNGQVFSILDLRNLPEQGLASADGLAFDLPQDEWDVAYRMLSATNGNTEYVRKGEKLQSWTELFTSQRSIGLSKATTAEEMRDRTFEQLSRVDPALEFEILKDTPNDTIYTWTIGDNAEHPAQFEVVRLVRGEQDMHRLAWTKKGADLDSDEKSYWISLLQSARLLPKNELQQHLREEQLQREEGLLLQLSRQILQRQLELIKKGQIEPLRKFYLPEIREQITGELLEIVETQTDDLNPLQVMDSIEMKRDDETLEAKLIDADGNVFTTLIQQDGRWYAKDIWLLKYSERVAASASSEQK